MIKNLRERFKIRLINFIPYLIGSVIFIILPIILLVIRSAESNSENWQESIIRDPSLWKILFRSVYMGLIASLFSLFIIFPFAWVIARTKSKTFKTFSLLLILSPLLIFTVVKVFALKVLLLNIFDKNYLEPKQYLIVIGMIYIYSPFMIIPLYSVIKTLPNNLLEASQDLGYSNLRTIFKVVLPYCLKAIFAGLAMVFMLSATTLVMSQTLIDGGTKNINTQMIGNHIDLTAQSINSNTYNSIRTSTISLITIGVMLGIYSIIYFTPLVLRKIKGDINV